MENKITIIIPVYNTMNYLEKCVKSVLNQSYSNLQIILVNDGSTDKSAIICDTFSKMDQRIEVIHKDNEGLGLTRNKGIEYAKGEYLTFLDSDDWLEQKHIENLLYEGDGYDLVFGSYTIATNDGRPLGTMQLPYCGKIKGKEIRNKPMLSIISAEKGSRKDLGIPMSVCFNLYKTKIIKENNILFPSEKIVSSEDLFFNLLFLDKCKSVYFTQEAGYYYRYNPISISHGYDEKQIERTKQFYQELSLYSKKLCMPSEVKNRIDRCVVAKLRGLLLIIIRSTFNKNEKLKKMKYLLNEKWVSDLLQNYKMPNYRASLKITTYFMQRKMIICLYIILYIKNTLTNK